MWWRWKILYIYIYKYKKLGPQTLANGKWYILLVNILWIFGRKEKFSTYLRYRCWHFLRTFSKNIQCASLPITNNVPHKIPPPHPLSVFLTSPTPMLRRFICNYAPRIGRIFSEILFEIWVPWNRFFFIEINDKKKKKIKQFHFIFSDAIIIKKKNKLNNWKKI